VCLTLEGGELAAELRTTEQLLEGFLHRGHEGVGLIALMVMSDCAGSG